MKRCVRVAALSCLVIVVGMLSSACWLRAMFASNTLQTIYDYEQHEFREFLLSEFTTDTYTALCTSDGIFGSECVYYVNGVEVPSTWDLIEEFGVLGVLIDPLIVQVPVSTPAFTASYDAGSGFAPLVVTQTTEFQVEPDVTVSAEPGHKFLIFELPPNAANSITSTDAQEGHSFRFKIDWQPQSVEPLSVKAMFTVKVTSGDEAYYLPMLPCVTDFAEVPALSIPVTAGQHDLLPLAGSMVDEYADLACDGKVYDLRTDTEEPEPGYPFRLVVPGVAVDSKIN